MIADMPKGQIEIIRTVQGMLNAMEDPASVTPALINARIDMLLAIEPRWEKDLDRDFVVDELIRRCSLWIGKNSILADETGHVPWLTAERRRERKYWRRYEDWLERRMPRLALDAVDHSTERVLELLEDPLRQGAWDRRGLVVGHVQSGKTANYTGLINKAADAGYKIIVVLAGVHNNLRSQTQVRLDEGFLGFDTHPERSRMVIGAGEIDPDPALVPDYATNRSEAGDFNPSSTRNFGITPDRRPCLFVVKKNKTPLNRLLTWLESHVADTRDPATGTRRVTSLPLLLIDDEADHASVDTGEQDFGPDGTPDEEHNPTTINRLIRRILKTFTRSAYVGYTATPFANIFIHEKSETRNEGPDLFPSAFIINLPASSDYVGPSRVFGLRAIEGRTEALPVVRMTTDFATSDGRAGWMPSCHKSAHTPLVEGEDRVPDSLAEAIDAFILACAARRLRGQARKHSSMLIHVTRFNLVQAHVVRQVSAHVQAIRQRISRRMDHEEVLGRLERLWREDFAPTTTVMADQWPDLSRAKASTWEDVQSVLADVLDEIQVRAINGTAKDVLDYQEAEAIGLKVIAVGGDKLSRGLTLEGLCVSYFLRASRMYDTLMQMGRWFGYRPGYVDLCRLYTTRELFEWFGHIADASEELREEFDIMANAGETPKTFGHKVASHPVLLVTSRIKMRSAKDLWLSFSGDVLETVVFHKETHIIRRNRDALEQLVSAMGVPLAEGEFRKPRPQGESRWEGHLWEGISPEAVCNFLDGYATHKDSYKVNSGLISEFIRRMNALGELTSWTVAIVGGGEGQEAAPGGLKAIRTLRRKDKHGSQAYTIGRLLSPRDEAMDLDSEEWNIALADSIKAFHADPARSSGKHEEKAPPSDPGGVAIRRLRGQNHPERGMLLLYLLDPALAGEGVFPAEAPPVVGFGISFPSSRNGAKVKYTVNSVMLRQWEGEYDVAE